MTKSSVQDLADSSNINTRQNVGDFYAFYIIAPRRKCLVSVRWIEFDGNVLTGALV